MTPIEPEADRLKGRGDDIYAALVDAHDGLSDGESAALNNRLVLILANLVGDPDAVIAAIRRSKDEIDAGDGR